MIIGEQKPLEEVKDMLEGYKKILIAGCGSCVTICLSGGEKEVAVLASALRLSLGKEIEIEERTVARQCEWEFIDELKDLIEDTEVVLSTACGVGVQAVAERFPKIPILPGLNTSFMGMPVEAGVWKENCSACGDCILDTTGGLCPITRCAKSLLNGPCGGSQEGKCEISPEVDCIWQLIYERLKTLNSLKDMEKIASPKDWSVNRDGGPRKIVREDQRT